MKYTHVYSTDSAQTQAYKWTSSYKMPWLSMSKASGTINYNKRSLNSCICLMPVTDATFSFTQDVNYSLDGGFTWNELAADEPTPTIVAGDEVLFYKQTSDGSVGRFSCTSAFDAKGNAMSLVNGLSFEGVVSLSGKSNIFKELFKDSSVRHAKDLVLPATTLAESCYDSMFYGCSSLVDAPELPAETLADRCYFAMFVGCSSLASAPELPALTLADYCYYAMFNSCTSLVDAPELPATTLDYCCYSLMFYGCSNLENAPDLMAAQPVEFCYRQMFQNCSKISEITVGNEYTLDVNYADLWLDGCAATGVIHGDFVDSGVIPSGWTLSSL